MVQIPDIFDGGRGGGCSPMRSAEIYNLGIQPKSFEDSDFIVLYDRAVFT